MHPHHSAPIDTDPRSIHIHGVKRQRLDQTGTRNCFSPFCTTDAVPSADVEAEDVGNATIVSAPIHRQRVPPREVPDDVVRFLAADLHSLTMEDREKVYEDVHGIRRNFQEASVNLDQKLQELHAELDRIHHKPAYEQAKSMSPDYVTGSEFCLMFLRCHEFQAKPAAQQIVNHFQVKESIFGADKLGRPLRMDDLSEADQDVLKSGGLHTLAQKDTSGRTIIFLAQRVLGGHKPENVHRAAFYHGIATLQDVEAQKNGCVFVFWSYGSVFQLNPKDLMIWHKLTEVGNVHPFRIVCMHYCGPGNQLHPVMRAILSKITKSGRLRFKLHFGSALESMYALASFGLRKDSLPVNDVDEIGNSMGWFNFRKQQEEVEADADADADGARNPTGEAGDIVESRGVNADNHNGGVRPYEKERDVLLGEYSKTSFLLPGNVYYRELISQYAPRYNASRSNKAKKELRDRVISTVEGEGRRFWTREVGNTYRIVEPDQVRIRTSQAFRNHRRHLVKK